MAQAGPSMSIGKPATGGARIKTAAFRAVKAKCFNGLRRSAVSGARVLG